MVPGSAASPIGAGRRCAKPLALPVFALLVVSTFGACTASDLSASNKRVALKASWAKASCPMAVDLAFRPTSTSYVLAWVYALIGHTSLGQGAVTIYSALICIEQKRKFTKMKE